MFENLADGFVGLFLFIGNWLSPGADEAEIRILAAEQLSQSYAIECAIGIRWNEQMGDLIDAGVPLRFRMRAIADKTDTTTFIRTLTCDLSQYTYSYTDSMVETDSTFTSEQYGQVLLAMRRYCRWGFSFPSTIAIIELEAELLPSPVSRLNRMVEMSNICGCKRFTRTIAVKGKE